MLIDTLKDYGFSEKEAKIYLATLELGNSIASSIARKSNENRITTYSLLKELKKRGIINEITKDGVKYFSAQSPDMLLKFQERKLDKLKQVIPELMALSNIYSNNAKVYFYDGVEKLKELFKEIVDEGSSMTEPYLTFVGTLEIDEKIKNFLETDFITYRSKQKTLTRAIIADSKSEYIQYHKERYETLIISDPIFEMGNEIVLYGNNKVGILSYFSKEIYGLVIESDVLYKGLQSMFYLIWKAYKK